MIRAVADHRGKFIQDTESTLFLKITDFEGNAVDPESISISITNDSSGSEAASGTPDKIIEGLFFFDWKLEEDETIGAYTAVWTYEIDGLNRVELQGITVIASGDAESTSLYVPVLNDMRMALTSHISCAQYIPIYNEQGRKNNLYNTYSFTFPRWNQSAGVRIYRNDKLVDEGIEVNYFKGTVEFDDPLTKYDTVHADYNFRWFSDEQLDRFLSNAVHIVNTYPPFDNLSILGLVANKPQYIPMILYGAAKDALRELIMCLLFQEPAQVFGGPDKAQEKISAMETLKKNFEDDMTRLLEQKKYGSYVGLTKAVVVPEFTLPGGRSRWFRYLFSTN